MLACIVELTIRDGRSPSLRQMQHALDLSEARIRQLIDQLVATGRLERRAGIANGLIVLDPDGLRAIAVAQLRRLGWTDAAAIEGCAHPRLPVLDAIAHLPGVTWPEL